MRITASFALTFACGATATPQARPTSTPFGTASPYTIVAMPDHARWSVICQARHDSDKDGKVAVYWQLHGEETGDAMQAYFIDSQNRESLVDNVLAYTDRWLVIEQAETPVLIDTTTGKRQPLSGTLPEFRIAGGLHVWRFDPSGERLLFFRDGAPIVRTLATGAETKIAPVAWRAEWSADGSWVELSILEGDTNGDGFVHGPDLSPGEGIPGRDCGRKFDWVTAIFDLDPEGKNVDAALASLDADDRLVRRLWRVADGFTIAGETAVDRDTIITRTTDGAFTIGPVGSPGTPLADASCKVAGVSPPLRAALVTCPAGEKSEVLWFRDGQRVSVAHIDDPRGANIGAGLFEIDSVLGNMRTGAVIRRERFLWMPWHDDEHAFVLSDKGVELRWTSGRVIELERKPDSDWWHASPYFVYATTRIDLRTGAKTTVPAGAIRLRDDGAVLLDGGPQRLDENDRGPRVGPLRWMTPRG